jgi:hypothetical protein
VLRGGSFDDAVLMVVERWRDFELMSADYATAEHAGACGALNRPPLPAAGHASS